MGLEFWLVAILAVALPFLVSFMVSILIAPGGIWLLKRWKIGQTIQEDGPTSHRPKAGTPTMGGIIIVAGMLASVCIYVIAIQPGLAAFRNLYALLALIVSFSAVGLVDDYLTVKPVRGVRGIASKPKAVIQFLLATGFVLWLRQTGFQPELLFAAKSFYIGEVYWPLAVLFITGMANFVNITDGLDGLVSGLFITAGFLFAPISLMLGCTVYNIYPNIPISALENGAIVFIVMMSAVGACLAFLWFNRHPAKVFMGDTGSLTLGALLPAAAILVHREILMIVVGSVFILDGFSTIIQWAFFKYTRIRTGTGRRVFLKSPVHHHFEMLGWPEQTVVVRFWICGVVAAALGFAGAAMGWW
ncbi:MAG: phospho-N-acetylmuramoyl-pentapeptide-transferase [Armatimonadota bacterium]